MRWSIQINWILVLALHSFAATYSFQSVQPPQIKAARLIHQLGWKNGCSNARQSVLLPSFLITKLPSNKNQISLNRVCRWVEEDGVDGALRRVLKKQADEDAVNVFWSLLKLTVPWTTAGEVAVAVATTEKSMHKWTFYQWLFGGSSKQLPHDHPSHPSQSSREDIEWLERLRWVLLDFDGVVDVKRYERFLDVVVPTRTRISIPPLPQLDDAWKPVLHVDPSVPVSLDAESCSWLNACLMKTIHAGQHEIALMLMERGAMMFKEYFHLIKPLILMSTMDPMLRVAWFKVTAHYLDILHERVRLPEYRTTFWNNEELIGQTEDEMHDTVQMMGRQLSLDLDNITLDLTARISDLRLLPLLDLLNFQLQQGMAESLLSASYNLGLHRMTDLLLKRELQVPLSSATLPIPNIQPWIEQGNSYPRKKHLFQLLLLTIQRQDLATMNTLLQHNVPVTLGRQSALRSAIKQRNLPALNRLLMIPGVKLTRADLVYARRHAVGVYDLLRQRSDDGSSSQTERL
jgi:hypothetical protein